MGEINWDTQEVVLNPSIINNIPLFLSWMPERYKIELETQCNLDDHYEDFYDQVGISVNHIKERGLYNIENTETTGFSLLLFCMAFKRNPESVRITEINAWVKKVGRFLNVDVSKKEQGLSEIPIDLLSSAVKYIENPSAKIYDNFKYKDLGILKWLPKKFFIVPFQQYPFMNFWETPFPEKVSEYSNKGYYGYGSKLVKPSEKESGYTINYDWDFS